MNVSPRDPFTLVMHIAGAARHRRPRQRGARPPRGAGRSDGVAESGIEARRRRQPGRLVSWRSGTNPPWRARSALSAPPTIGASVGSRPKSGCCANATWAPRPESGTTRCTCPPTARSAPSYTSPINAGRSAAVPGTQGRGRARSPRGAQPAGLATPRRVDGARVQHPSAGTPTARTTQLTLPRVRAVIQEVLTAHLFMTRPGYLQWMLKLKDVQLRIRQSRTRSSAGKLLTVVATNQCARQGVDKLLSPAAATRMASSACGGYPVLSRSRGTRPRRPPPARPRPQHAAARRSAAHHP